MKRIISVILILLSLSCYAQQERKRITSPYINEDGTITFYLNAPNAQSVQIIGDFLAESEADDGGTACLVNNCGIWEYTTSKPLISDMYYYNYIVDGVKTIDPANVHIMRDTDDLFNVFMVDGQRADLYKVNDVPHGSLSVLWYDSEILGFDRRLIVYTPASYENTPLNRYPVLYLLHGSGNDEESWLTLGRATQILDNLIATGKSKEMIAVMVNEYVTQEGRAGAGSSGFVVPSKNNNTTGRIEVSKIKFEDVFPEIVSYIDSNFRTVQNKNNRAIAGLSMGGFFTSTISRQWPELFDYVGVFSAGLKKPLNEQEAEIIDQQFSRQFANPPALYWIGIGKADFLYESSVEMRRYFDKKGYKYTYYENGLPHCWKTWRIYLSEYATLIFK